LARLLGETPVAGGTPSPLAYRSESTQAALETLFTDRAGEPALAALRSEWSAPAAKGGAAGELREGFYPALFEAIVERTALPEAALQQLAAFVEASTMSGKGELVLTGQLGEVMKESARAAWTYARSHAAELGIDEETFKRDLHVHVPAGAVPKEGPSAGVAMATALVSSLSGRPARHDVAMTGEITLSGRVLPIGGVKEKVLGAVRAGLTEVLLPKQNEGDLDDLPEDVRSSLVVHAVEELGQALALTLRGASYREGRLHFEADEKQAAAREIHH
jgi:hypothetical protein